MSVLHIKTKLEFNELLKVVEQLEPLELEKITTKIISLKAKRKATNYSKQESEIILKINQGIPKNIQQHFNDLQTKRQTKTLNTEGQQELIELSKKIEQQDADRIKLIAQLAKLQGVTLNDVMKSLGITRPEYA